MIQRPTGADMPVYASLSTMRQQPTQDEIANGVIPLDTLPANWWNWLWNTITRAQNDLQYNDEVIFTEINNVLAAGGIVPNPTADAQATHDQLIRAINIIKNAVATTTTLGVVKSSDTGTDGTVRVNTGGTMNVNGFGDLATLHTVGKDTITGAINEVHDEMDALNTNLTQEIQNEASEIRGEIGTLSSLTTTSKNNLVAAVNEVQSKVNTATSTANTNKTAIGTLSSLTTTAKGNLVAAVNEVQSEVNTATSTANTANSTANTNKTAIGTLSSLTTTAKGNLVAAINEVQSEVNTATSTANTNKTAIGTLSSLTTTAKTNLVAAVNEVQSEVNSKLPMYRTSMLRGGFVSSQSGYTSLYNFWMRLTQLFGHSAAVHFYWSHAEEGHVSIDGTSNTDSVYLSGSTVIYNSSATPDNAWAVFTALVIPGGEISDAYIMSTRTSDTPGLLRTSKITKLAAASDVEAASSTYRYTFVVDSNAALTAWANNDRSGGKDYTSVLIRKGTWTSSKGVNLTAAGTKVVVGEAGSKLVFNNVMKGLYYDVLPTGSDYYMRGVTVTVTGSVVVSGPGSGSVYGNGFYACTNLSNCSGSASGTNSGTGSGISTVTGFNDCTNLSNCSGSGTGTGYGYGTGTGFYACTNLSNCSGSGTGTGSGTSIGYGFNDCTNLSNCSGSGTGTGYGYGFSLCTGAAHCKARARCTTTVFNVCYADSARNDTYACADTANGGFNNTKNPA